MCPADPCHCPFTHTCRVHTAGRAGLWDHSYQRCTLWSMVGFHGDESMESMLSSVRASLCPGRTYKGPSALSPGGAISKACCTRRHSAWGLGHTRGWRRCLWPAGGAVQSPRGGSGSDNRENTQGPGKTVLSYGDPWNCEAHPLKLLVRPHAVQILVLHPGPCGVLVESGSGRGCCKVRSRKMSPRRRRLLGECIQRRYSCGQRPHRVTCVE